MGVEAVRHCRSVQGAIKRIKTMDDDELFVLAKEMRVPYDLVVKTKELGRLPVVNFAAGGVATPADAALMMQLGVDGVFVGSGILRAETQPEEPRPSSRPRPTTTTQRSSLRCRLAWESPWLASTSGRQTSRATPRGASE